ncbi:MAG: DUF1987 domain-containing protein [Flavobacteriales bacterium]|nr:DUF1987 domain-containing protein [Flavobacteriales bacterium]
MSQLVIAPTKSTPEIFFHPAENIFMVKGISTPINAFEFYQNIVAWMNDHESAFPQNATFVFNLPYFNSATMKAILILLERIKTGIDQGKDWTIEWFVEDDDEFMLEAAESFQGILGINIKIIS